MVSNIQPVDVEKLSWRFKKVVISCLCEICLNQMSYIRLVWDTMTKNTFLFGRVVWRHFFFEQPLKTTPEISSSPYFSFSTSQFENFCQFMSRFVFISFFTTCRLRVILYWPRPLVWQWRARSQKVAHLGAAYRRKVLGPVKWSQQFQPRLPL